MKLLIRKTAAWFMALIMALTMFSMPVAAVETPPADKGAATEEQAGQKETQSAEEEQKSVEEIQKETPGESENEQMIPEISSSAGDTVSGTFAKVNGKDIATVRYYTNPEKSSYAFASVQEQSGEYSYSFKAPYDGFTAVQGASKDDANATVIAEYYSTSKWDGAVDVSWYSSSQNNFSISTPAQLAGLAAIVNGSINSSTPIYKVKGSRTGNRAYSSGNTVRTFDYDTPQTSKHQDINEGLPNCIENRYYPSTDLIAGVKDEAYEGLASNDFSGKTVNITANMDMGGGSVDHSRNETAEANTYDYPNWTPIGGEYLMDPSDSTTMIKASFNGSLNGGGHHINNLYCYRWSYRSVGGTAYGYAQGTGLIGMMGSLYDGEANPSVMPSVKNMSLSGYIYGRRMVGGFVGCMGGGSNAASGASLEGGITMENLANHAEIHCTDSKGLGGIVACSMIDKGSIINCYNTGNLDANYAAPSGGIIGSNEGMSIYCCYNTGTIDTRGNSRGRGIGCNNGGSNYTVNDCYYLEGSGDDEAYPGYYTYNLPKSIRVNTTVMTEKELSDGSLLARLNVNGRAYVSGDNGRPVLYWERNNPVGTGSLTLSQETDKGTISATKTGSMPNGSVVYLSAEAENGWKCRSFNLNGSRLSGKYLTVNGSSTVNGNYEEALPGIIKFSNDSDVYELSITKNGQINENGVVENVSDYPVNSGDPIYEGDVLMLDISLKEGAAPEDEDLIYKASKAEYYNNSGLYEFKYDYLNGDDESIESSVTEGYSFTVDSNIAGEDVSLKLSVSPLTGQKMWDHKADTSWYDDSENSFTIRTPEQLAGLSVLVDQGKNFRGKTVNLAKDISLANNDGTNGRRFWDGIGDTGSDDIVFAGTFDGNDHKITDYNGNANGLFASCQGNSDTDKATVRDVELWGESKGQNACGIVAEAKNTVIEGCISYCVVEGSRNSESCAGILGQAKGGCEIKDCVNYARIKASKAGGIVGDLNATDSVSGCINKGNLYSLEDSSSNIGGIAGSLRGTISKSANYGNLDTRGGNTGGIAGASLSKSAKIDNCSNLGELKSKRGKSSYDSIGGIVGYGSFFDINQSFNYGSVQKVSGQMPDANIGAIFGRLNAQSTNKTDETYYLEGSCEFAATGTRQADLDTSAGYFQGIKSANSAAFASSASTGVLSAINMNKSPQAYELRNSRYPELKASAGLHVHSGGSATCSVLAVCDECGLSYGLYSDIHGETKLTGAKPVVWLTDGYTGNLVCKDCGETVQEGAAIAADPDRQIVELVVAKGDRTVSSKTYSVKEFDDLKTTNSPIGYSYGSKSDEIVAATQYVTLSRILEEANLTMTDINSIDVICDSASANISTDTLNDCSKYFEGGQEYSAPATFMIAWNTGAGSLDTVARESKITGTVRFGYGISQTQFDENEAVGGARLISPVNTIRLNLSQPKVEYNGTEEYLDDALAAAENNGGTIKLKGDTDTGDKGFVFDGDDKTLTLDLGGYELSSNAENCIDVRSGTLIIKGEGKVSGRLAASAAGKISAEGGSFDYELEKEHCADGYVPALDSETGLYNIVRKSAYEASGGTNALKAEYERLLAEFNKLSKKVQLLNVTVSASAKATSWNTVVLTIGADSDVDGYLVQKNINGSWTDIEVGGDTFTDVAEPGIKNEYRVAAGLNYDGVRKQETVYGKYAYAYATTAIGKAGTPSVTTKSKKLTVKWKPVDGADSYDVYIGTNSSVTSGLVKYNNVKSTAVTSKTLKKNKYYYVKVRAHRKNSEGTVVYGSWSSAKKIKCK